MVVMLVITLVGAWTSRVAVKDQEARLLKERTNEIALVLTSSIGSLPAPLDVLGGVLRVTRESPVAFRMASAAAETGTTGTVTFALVRKTPAGFVVALADGPSLHRGQVITDQRAQAFQHALTTTKMVPTAVIGHGATRALGFVIGPPISPAGTVLYREDLLGPIGAPRSAGTAPFSELNVVIYAGAGPNPSEVLARTTNTLPLSGPVHTEPLSAGAATWTLQASAVHPLVGRTTEDAPWIVLIGGIFLALLVGLVIEVETRRRKAAVALYNTEHRVAETLQLSLLPSLPVVAGLGTSARYLPGAAHQDIGGDWFDVFEIHDGRVGLVIGDVVGHDVAAAAAMAKIQASLRAVAFGGAEPSEVLDQVDGLITSFDISELVTVFYGLLDRPDRDGGRMLTYANGGHLPPLVRGPDGVVDVLDVPHALVLGAPTRPGDHRQQAQLRLSAGSTLLLFTDGLIEVPGESLTASLAALRATVTSAAADVDANGLCDVVLADVDEARLRDDVAVLTVRVEVLIPPRRRGEDSESAGASAEPRSPPEAAPAGSPGR
jgi:hypothetical protein